MYYATLGIATHSGLLLCDAAAIRCAVGAGLQPLFDAHKAFVFGVRVLHADETPVAMLDPGAGKTKRAYLWACARGGFEPQPGVAYDFCINRAARHPVAFLKGWSDTLVCDDYGGYDSVLKLETRIEAGCVAHARRKFDELLKSNQSPVAAQAMQRSIVFASLDYSQGVGSLNCWVATAAADYRRGSLQETAAEDRTEEAPALCGQGTYVGRPRQTTSSRCIAVPQPEVANGCKGSS